MSEPEVDLSQYPSHIPDHVVRYSKPPSAMENTNTNSEAHSEHSSTRFNFDFLRIGSSSQTKDGEKPKRRGPKPDSKPALTRRQELNRQAQRTHRERKERYVKTLEEEVVRLREAFAVITKEKTTVLEENRRLKALLEAHGISPNLAAPNLPIGHFPPQRQEPLQQMPVDLHRNVPYDYNEIGIDFVLGLEEPCMDHIQFLANNSVKPDADYHGHAMMTIFPPESHVLNHPDVPWGHRTFDLNAGDLATLFNLSNRLQLEGELTPIAVWVLMTRHARFAELNLNDFNVLKEELVGKVKCHGFGAVVEEFEVEDALTYMFSKKYGYTLG